MTRDRGTISFLQALLLGPLPVALAWVQDWYVDVNAPNCGTGTGTQADPFCDVMVAVAAASDGDTIRIAPGTYFENVVLDKDLELIGTGGEQVTILDGNAAGRVVLVSDSVVSLIGLTLTNGDAGGSNGGGLLMDATSIVALANSTVSNNSAFHCGRPGYCGGSGGGVCSLGGPLTIVDSTVMGNSAYQGSGIYCAGGPVTLLESTVTANPGVAILGSGATLMLTNTRISQPGACYSGGDGVFVREGALTLTDSSITDVCVAVDVADGTLEILNSTISSEAGVGASSSTVSMVNSIFWNGPLWLDGSSSATVRYSLVQGGWPGVGNIDADPLFADPLNGNFRLLQGSPCIDAGSNVAVPLDILFDLDGRNRFIEDSLTPDTGRPGRMRPIVDMGAHEGPFFPGRHARRR